MEVGENFRNELVNNDVRLINNYSLVFVLNLR